MATYNVTSSPYSAVGNGKLVTDGAMSNGSAVLTSATAVFAAGDVGKKIAVSTSNGAAGMLVTTISGFTNATTITLATTAPQGTSSATVLWGSDDTSKIQDALDDAGDAGGGTVYIPTPPGGTRYLVTHLPYSSGDSLACLRIPSNVRVTGDGASSLVQLLPPTSGLAFDVFASKNSLYVGYNGSTAAAPSVVDSNIRVDQIGVDGSKTLLLTASEATAHGFYFSRCGNVELNTVYMANCGSGGAVLEFSRASSVIGCYSTGHVKTAIYVVGSESVSVTGNVSYSDGDGIYIAASWYCAITGNTIQGWGPLAGSHAGIWLTRDARYNSVTGNTVSKGSAGSSSNGAIQLSPQALGASPTLHGITGGGGVDSADQYPYCASFNTITGNTVTDNGGIGIYLADYADFNVVGGNVISGNGNSGILVQGAQNNHIKANVILNNMDAVSIDTAGIRVGSAGANRPTTGNRVYDNDISDYPVYEFTTLGGTAATTSASAAVTGTSAAYSTDLAVDRPLFIPTGGTETYKTVSAIGGANSLTASSNYGTTASGKTVTAPKTSNQITHPSTTQTISIIEDNLPTHASGAGVVDSNDYFRNKVSGSVTTVGLNSRTDLASCRTYASGGASVATATLTPLAFNTNRWNIGGIHFTSAANLTGTVSKTSGSTTLTGTSTLFASELSVGQVIDVPGGSTERRVVTRIVSNTQLIVAVAFGSTASGQTAVRVNTAMVCQSAGLYSITGNAEFFNSAGGTRRDLQIRLNGTTIVGTANVPAANAFQEVNVQTIYRLSRWDYVELIAYQDSGGNLTIGASVNYSPEFMMERIGD